MLPALSQQKWSWPIWSALYNISVEILRKLTNKLTRASTRTRAMSRASARAWLWLGLRIGLGLGLGLWLALGLGLGSVFTFKYLDRFCRRTKFIVTGPVLCMIRERHVIVKAALYSRLAV